VAFLDLHEGVLEEFGERSAHAYNFDWKSLRGQVSVVKGGIQPGTLAKLRELSETRKCERCKGGMTFLFHGGWRKRFCSLNCKQRFYYQRDAPRFHRECHMCSAWFETTRPMHSKYCRSCSEDRAGQARLRAALRPEKRSPGPGRPPRYHRSERDKMVAMRRMGFKLTAIARLFRCSKSVVSRYINWNERAD
jgi:hypothetical protein